MEDSSLIFDILFDYIDDPILILSSSGSPIKASKAFLKNIHHLADEKSLDLVLSALGDLNSYDLKKPQIIELQFENNNLKVKLGKLTANLYLIKIISQHTKKDIKRNLHAQRIETLGLLAGGVAHDFNNILTGLLGHVTYLKNVLPQSGSHAVSVKAIEEGAKRASTLTKEILNFSRLESSEKAKKVDLKEIIEKTYNLLKGAIPPQYELKVSTPQVPVCILADEAKIAQIIVNLAINSKDATPKGGKILIELSIVNDKKELKKVFSDRDLAAENYACIKVTDSGSGMSKEVLSHVFEPYFSTKADKGNGLGLYIVSEVVNMFSGAIHIITKEAGEKDGGGTTIAVFFPLMESVLDENTAIDQSAGSQLSKGSGHILVVDDEQPVRNVLLLSLEHLGYTVTCAASGLEAIEFYKHSNKPYDLVLLDMLMPQMTGDEVFFHLKEIDPNVKVLLISGYSSQEAVNNVIKNGGLGIIQKPFTISDLAERVKKHI